MNYENFSVSLKQIAPRHKPEAAQLWRDFAVECVELGQYVNFEVIGDKSLAAEKWLDVLYAGFYAVKESFSEDIVEKVIGLSCEKCCLYPGEMMQAAVFLDNGCDANDIIKKIESGMIDPPNLFSPTSREEAMGIDRADKEPKPSVLERLNRVKNDISSVKKDVTKERGAER